jgi:hypothetical protein
MTDKPMDVERTLRERMHNRTGWSFQQRVREWTVACFGQTIADDKIERNHRFLEESLELVQALGCTRSEAHQLVDYVFARPEGTPEQECGGVKVTLAALCNANGLDMLKLGERELERAWSKIEKIRAKQAAKPKHSPLSEAVREALREPGVLQEQLDELAEHIACKIQRLLSDKYTNTFLIVHGIIRQELRAALSSKQEPPAPARNKPNPNCPLCQGLGSWVEGQPCGCTEPAPPVEGKQEPGAAALTLAGEFLSSDERKQEVNFELQKRGIAGLIERVRDAAAGESTERAKALEEAAQALDEWNASIKNGDRITDARHIRAALDVGASIIRALAASQERSAMEEK